MPREFQTEGIVLRSRTIGEDDLLVDFLTPDQGRLSGVARHGRKSRKRFGTVLESLNILRLRYRDGGSFVALEEAGLEVPLLHITEDLSRVISAFYLVDLVREFVHERSSDQRLYDLLKESLLALNEHRLPQTPQTLVRVFEHRFLNLLGYGPNLKTCASCGREWSGGKNFYFVFREGGIYCADCLPKGGSFEPFSEESLHKILSRFLDYQLGRPPRSRKFLTNAAFCE